MTRQASRAAPWHVPFALRFILLITAAVATAVLVGGWWTYVYVRDVLMEQELRALSLETEGVARPFVDAVDEARAAVELIAETPPVPAWTRAAAAGGVDPLSGDDLTEWRARLETIMLATLATRPYFSQIRFIGVADQGLELARVNRGPAGDPSVVTQDALQLKGTRPYFLETTRLAPGQFYVSDVRLNQENGQIETPWVPSIRVGTPVFGVDGEVFGALVLNVDLRPVFETLRVLATDARRVYLVNEAGDFLVHPDSSRVFRFEIGERDGLESEFPAAVEAFSSPEARSGGSYRRVSEGEDVGIGLYQARFDPSDPSRYVGLVVAEDYASLAASAAAARNRAISFAMLMLPVAVLFGWLMVRRVTATLGAEPAALDAVSALIADGTLDVELPGKEGRRVGVLRSLESMLTHLRSGRSERERRTWIGDGLAHLIGVAQRCGTEEELASKVIEALAETLGAAQGLFYIASAEDGGRLHLRGTCAFDARRRNEDGIDLGEGLVGQAAADLKIHEMRGVPPTYLTIGSGLGEAAPASVIAVPLVYEREALGVIELATFGDFDGVKRELLSELADDLSVIVWGLRGKSRAIQLMKTAQESAEELQAANEELRVTNEELATRSEELRRQSEELNALNVSLEEKSEELRRREAEADRRRLLIEKQHEELERTTRQLAEASRYKSEFLANMSHELRTPLNSLLILSQGLAENSEGNLTPEQVKAAQIVHSGGQELLELINDILDLSKIEAGKVELHPTEVLPRELVEDLRRQFQPLADKTGVEFRVELSEGVPSSIRTDGQRLRQVLKNFLSNAFKFTKQGSVTLVVQRHADDVAFRVADTGIGIPEDKQQVIFEAFQQADGSTSRRYGGTGLGLAISLNLARLLGGSIELRSAEGAGSTFSLVLPRGRAGPTTDGAHTSGVQVDPASEARVRSTAPAVVPVSDAAGVPHEDWVADDRDELDGRRPVLIVEDDRAFAEILVNLARSRGHAAIATPSGRRAMRLAKAHDLFAVVLDLNLPDMSGLDVLDFFKGDLATRHVPVHVVSALDERIASLSAGAVGFLAKPTRKVDLEGIFTKLEEEAGGRPRHVLVVEDDEVAATALVEALRVDGTSVRCVGSLTEAGDALDSERFDCVVLDLRLPDGNGLDFLETRRRSATRPLPPVIVHTAEEPDDETYRRLRAAAEEIVLKGVSSIDRVLDEVTIFLHTVDAALTTEQRSTLSALRDSDQTIRGKRVLVVDDDLRNSFALSQALSKRGLEVQLAEDGQQALDLLEGEEDADIVLMDIMMPRMDGYETMRRLRMDPRFKDLPIIALTANAMPEDRQRCLDAGASDYLSKPVDVNRLLSVMRVWMFGS